MQAQGLCTRPGSQRRASGTASGMTTGPPAPQLLLQGLPTAARSAAAAAPRSCAANSACLQCCALLQRAEAVGMCPCRMHAHCNRSPSRQQLCTAAGEEKEGRPPYPGPAPVAGREGQLLLVTRQPGSKSRGDLPDVIAPQAAPPRTGRWQVSGSPHGPGHPGRLPQEPGCLCLQLHAWERACGHLAGRACRLPAHASSSAASRHLQLAGQMLPLQGGDCCQGAMEPGYRLSSNHSCWVWCQAASLAIPLLEPVAVAQVLGAWLKASPQSCVVRQVPFTARSAQRKLEAAMQTIILIGAMLTHMSTAGSPAPHTMRTEPAAPIQRAHNAAEACHPRCAVKCATKAVHPSPRGEDTWSLDLYT